MQCMHGLCPDLVTGGSDLIPSAVSVLLYQMKAHNLSKGFNYNRK